RAPAWPGSLPLPGSASSGRPSSCGRRARAPAGRCCSRRASFGVIATCRRSETSARRVTRRCSGSSGDALAARSGGSLRVAAQLRLRANTWSTGDGLEAGLARGAALTRGMEEFYGRNMPDAPWDETELISLSQLYGRFARIFDEDGVEFFSRERVSWSETNV